MRKALNGSDDSVKVGRKLMQGVRLAYEKAMIADAEVE